jgi:hypothetical protein
VNILYAVQRFISRMSLSLKTLYVYISAFYLPKIRNTSQIVCLLVRNAPYIPYISLYIYIYAQIDLISV